MPRYFFHIDQPRALADIEGKDLENLQAAKCAVMHIIADVLCADRLEFWDAHEHRVRVTNADHLTLFVVDVLTTKAAAIS